MKAMRLSMVLFLILTLLISSTVLIGCQNTADDGSPQKLIKKTPEPTPTPEPMPDPTATPEPSSVMMYDGNNPAPLSELVYVQTLYIKNVDNLDFLKALPRLESLIVEFDDAATVNGQLSSLSGITTLRKLDIVATGIEGTLADLAPLNQLRFLNVAGTWIGGDLKDITHWKHLTHLTTQNSYVKGRTEDLGQLKKLEHLNVALCDIVGSIGDLQDLENLQVLIMYDIYNIMGDIRALRDLAQMEHLDLSSNPVKGDIGQLGSMRYLKSLGLDYSYVAGDIGDLAHLTDLAHLSVYSTDVTGHLADIRQMESLASLHLNDQIGGSHLILAGLPRLEYFHTADDSYSDVQLYWDVNSILDIQLMARIKDGREMLEIKGTVIDPVLDIQRMEVRLNGRLLEEDELTQPDGTDFHGIFDDGTFVFEPANLTIDAYNGEEQLVLSRSCYQMQLSTMQSETSTDLYEVSPYVQVLCIVEQEQPEALLDRYSMLREIHFFDCVIDDITPFMQMEGLRMLHFVNCTGAADLQSLNAITEAMVVIE